MARIEIEEPQPLPIVLGQAALRIVVGVIMAAHGWLKLNDLPAWQSQVAELGIPWPEVTAHLAVAAELLGGVGLVIGLMTRVAAFGVISVLVVAIASVHFDHGLFAQNGGFEFPLVLAVSALLILLHGPDSLSADTLLRRRARDLAIKRDEIWSQPPYVAVPEEALYSDAGERWNERERRRPFPSR